MKTEEELRAYLKANRGEIILFDSHGCQRLIAYDKEQQSLYYLVWSPRENTGEPREYIDFDKAIEYILKYKPQLLEG